MKKRKPPAIKTPSIDKKGEKYPTITDGKKNLPQFGDSTSQCLYPTLIADIIKRKKNISVDSCTWPRPSPSLQYSCTYQSRLTAPRLLWLLSCILWWMTFRFLFSCVLPPWENQVWIQHLLLDGNEPSGLVWLLNRVNYMHDLNKRMQLFMVGFCKIWLQLYAWAC